MNDALENLIKSVKHIRTLHAFFSNEENYNLPDDNVDFEIYTENSNDFIAAFEELPVFNQLYNQKDRQMILADLIEYILLGRGFYAIGSRRNNTELKGLFIKGVLHLVNLLMTYETITIDSERRNLFLDSLIAELPEIEDEEYFEELKAYANPIGLPGSNAPRNLAKYFDKLLPKTAGGLWHELLAYIFILRNNLGFILPLLLHQKIYSLDDHLVPPDYLILTKDKRIYGIEVGIKKEIQSGSFSLKTAIPTATVDTINSRTSDRCPSCNKWIGICPFVINNYSNVEVTIENIKVNCINDCNIYTPEEISIGICKYTKYSRSRAVTREHTHHNYSDGKHYHYQCVLNNVTEQKRNQIIEAQDSVGIKTHFPFYSGLEELK